MIFFGFPVTFPLDYPSPNVPSESISVASYYANNNLFKSPMHRYQQQQQHQQYQTQPSHPYTSQQASRKPVALSSAPNDYVQPPWSPDSKIPLIKFSAKDSVDGEDHLARSLGHHHRAGDARRRITSSTMFEDNDDYASNKLSSGQVDSRQPRKVKMGSFVKPRSLSAENKQDGPFGEVSYAGTGSDRGNFLNALS